MNLNKILSLGWFTAAVFIIGSLVMGSLVKDYDPMAQTVSEMGQEGSSFYLYWQVLSLLIGALLILFSFGLNLFARQHKLAIIPGVFMMFYGISQFGTGWFPSPHPLHNVFGLSMTLGYLSPLVFALSWKNQLGKSFQMISIFTFVVIMIGIFLNLTPAFAPNLYPLAYYGMVQRFLLFSFYLYVAYVSYKTLSYRANDRPT